MKEKGIIFDFKETEGDWFDFFESHVDLENERIIYDEPEQGTGRACFRSTMPFILAAQEKRKKKHEYVLNTKSKAMDRVVYFEELSAEEQKQFNNDMYDYAITGLERFFDAEENVLECTRENKLKLAKVPVFDRFMARCVEIQWNGLIKQKAVVEKNSLKP